MKKKKPVRVDHEGAGHLRALRTKARMQIPSGGKLDASVLRKGLRQPIASLDSKVAGACAGAEALCQPPSWSCGERAGCRIVRGDAPTGPDGPDTRRGAGPGRPRPNGPVAYERAHTSPQGPGVTGRAPNPVPRAR